jgi:hypothetical protein
VKEEEVPLIVLINPVVEKTGASEAGRMPERSRIYDDDKKTEKVFIRGKQRAKRWR